MGSITGLKTGVFTSIDNSGEIRLGTEINPGTAGQALVSGGPNQPARWDTHTGAIQPLTMGTDLSLASGNTTFDGSIPDTINAAGHGFGSGGNGIDITGTTISTDNDGTTITNTSGQNTVLKVPNALSAGTNLSFSSGPGTTYDGSAAITLNATDTNTQLNLTASDGITIINTGGLNRTISMSADNTTLSNNVGSGQAGVLKVPNALSAGTNLFFSSGPGLTYDGSAVRTLNATDTNTQLNLTGGANITITNTGGLNRTIALNGSLTSVDITDTSNTVSPYFLHDTYDPNSQDSDSLSTSYSNIFSSNLVNTFKAKQTSCAIELRVFNAQTSGTSGRFTYARLAGSGSTTTAGEFNTFYSTGGRNTERIIHQADESDDVNLTQTWILTGLTIGNNYSLYPQMRSSSSSSNFIRAGGTSPAAILRGYYLPTTSGGDDGTGEDY